MRCGRGLKGLPGHQKQDDDRHGVGGNGINAGPPGARLVGIRRPIEKKAQILCSFRLFYGFHPDGFQPDIRDCDTARECSSILARMAKAASRLRRAVGPLSFGVWRVSTASRKASNWVARGSALTTGSCWKEIWRSAPTLKTAVSCLP